MLVSVVIGKDFDVFCETKERLLEPTANVVSVYRFISNDPANEIRRIRQLCTADHGSVR